VVSLLIEAFFLELFPAFRCYLFGLKEKPKRISAAIGARAVVSYPFTIVIPTQEESHRAMVSIEKIPPASE
jgi:hypothetical protein